VTYVILLKCLCFFCGPNGCILQSSSGNTFLLILIFLGNTILQKLALQYKLKHYRDIGRAFWKWLWFRAGFIIPVELEEEDLIDNWL
jgi:hypothetical protein